jgi:hypothetical protein
MKRALTQTLLATLLVASTAFAARAQTGAQRNDPPPPAQPPAETPDIGRIEDGTYANDFFGFSFTLPKTWAVVGAIDNKKILEKGKRLIEGGSTETKAGLEAALMRTQILVTVSKYPAGTAGPDFNAALICIAERVPTAFIKTGADYISGTQRSLEGTAAKLELSGPLRTEKVGGADFTVADLKITAGTSVAVQRYYVRITKGYALAIAYTYYDDADLKTLDEILGTFKFK